MKAKFLRHKKIIIPIMVAMITFGGLGSYMYYNRGSELLDLLISNEVIEINYATDVYKDEVRMNDTRVELDKLGTYTKGFRQNFDKEMGVNYIQANNSDILQKSGCLYVSETGKQESNSTLYLALRNKVCAKTLETSKGVLAKLVDKVYVDVNSNDKEALNAVLNAYFDLLDDGTGEYNGDTVLNRQVLYALVYKTYNGVSKEYLSIEIPDETDRTYTLEDMYASKVLDNAYIKNSNSSLYKQTITKGEVIYLLMNTFYKDDIAKLNAGEVKAAKVAGLKNGGDVLDKQIVKSFDEALKNTNRYNEVTLKYMIEKETNTIETSMYNAISLANSLGLLDDGFNWYDSVSKDEALTYIVNTILSMNKQGFASEVAYGDYDTTNSEIIYTDSYVDVTYDEHGNVAIAEKVKYSDFDAYGETGALIKEGIELYEEALKEEGVAQAEIDKEINQMIQDGIEALATAAANGTLDSGAVADASKPSKPETSDVKPVVKPEVKPEVKPDTSNNSTAVVRKDSAGNKFNSKGEMSTGDGYVAVDDLSSILKAIYNNGERNISILNSQGYYTTGMFKGQAHSYLASLVPVDNADGDDEFIIS